jgi:hypothetical protein
MPANPGSDETPGAVYYQPLHHGLQNPTGDKAITYFGTTYRVPASAHNTIQQLEWETPPNELVQPLTLADGSQLQPDVGGIIERFETLDNETGDLLVLYRIPYRAANDDEDDRPTSESDGGEA